MKSNHRPTTIHATALLPSILCEKEAEGKKTRRDLCTRDPIPLNQSLLVFPLSLESLSHSLLFVFSSVPKQSIPLRSEPNEHRAPPWKKLPNQLSRSVERKEEKKGDIAVRSFDQYIYPPRRSRDDAGYGQAIEKDIKISRCEENEDIRTTKIRASAGRYMIHGTPKAPNNLLRRQDEGAPGRCQDEAPDFRTTSPSVVKCRYIMKKGRRAYLLRRGGGLSCPEEGKR